MHKNGEQVTCGRMILKVQKTSISTRKELKRKLYRAVANVNILEGIRFYVSFACSFAFGELKLMEGSAKIISLIARDETQHPRSYSTNLK